MQQHVTVSKLHQLLSAVAPINLSHFVVDIDNDINDSK